MKKVGDIIALDIVGGLPDMSNLQAASERVGQLQRIEDTRSFHASNITHDELDNLLLNCTGFIYTGRSRAQLVQRIKALKPSKKIVVSDEDFI
jgi:hypothetical protein